MPRLRISETETTLRRSVLPVATATRITIGFLALKREKGLALFGYGGGDKNGKCVVFTVSFLRFLESTRGACLFSTCPSRFGVGCVVGSIRRGLWDWRVFQGEDFF